MLKRRLILCQGSAQLIAGLAAMKASASQGEQCEDYLLISDLAAAPDQEAKFSSYLVSLGRSPCSFRKVIAIDTKFGAALLRTFAIWGIEAAKREARTLVGIDRVDEIFVGRSGPPVASLILASLSKAGLIAYGDGLGLYFREGYFREVRGMARTLMGARELLRLPALFAKRLSEGFYRPSRLPSVRFEKGYFVFPDAFGSAPEFPFECVPFPLLRDLLLRVAPDEATVNVVRSLVEGARSAIVLLTANSAEQGLMSYSGEVSAVTEFIKEREISDEVIVIKPHPRERPGKAQVLKGALERIGLEVRMLPAVFEPAEVFFSLALSNSEDFRRRLSVYGFSSACFGPAALWGIPTTVGFGERLLQEYFHPHMSELRSSQELDLKRGLSRVLMR